MFDLQVVQIEEKLGLRTFYWAEPGEYVDGTSLYVFKNIEKIVMTAEHLAAADYMEDGEIGDTVLFLMALAQPYLLNTSTTVRIHLYPPSGLLVMSTKSACQSWLGTRTFLMGVIVWDLDCTVRCRCQD